MINSRFLCGSLLALQALLASAADEAPAGATPADDSVDTVTVTAGHTASTADQIAQPTLVLRDDELRRKQVATLGETLSHELGVSSTAFGAGASRPLIRGLGGSRVRVLENGVSAMDTSSLSDDHAVSAEPAAAEQIEILQGPATLRYASGAFGGVVNVVGNRLPRSASARPRGQFDFGYDDASTALGGSGILDASYADLALHLEGGKHGTEDYTIPGFGDLHPAPGARRGVLANSDTASENISGGASYIGERGYLGFALSHHDADYGIPGDQPGRITLNEDRYDLAGELLAPLAGVAKLGVQLGHNDYAHQELAASGAVGTTFLNDEYEGRIELTHRPLAGFSGVAGVAVNHRDFAAIGAEQLTPPVVGRTVGVFTVERRDWGRLQFEFGARYENTQYEPALHSNPATAFDIYSVAASTTWQLAEGHAVGLAFTRGQRAPGFEELYNNGPHDATHSFERGDAGIRPETANNLDLTLRGGADRLTWQLDLFANYIEDFIYTRNTDSNADGVADHVDASGALVAGTQDLLLLQYAQHNAEFHGVEIASGYALWRDRSYGNLDLRLFADYVRGRLTNGDNLPRLTPLRFGGGLAYAWQAWSADFDVRRVQGQNANAPLETETAGYTLVTLGVSYVRRIGAVEYIVSARGNNLLDADIRYHTSLLKEFAPQPGRSALLSLRLRFE